MKDNKRNKTYYIESETQTIAFVIHTIKTKLIYCSQALDYTILETII